jgi:DNA-binding winged helix-turn-helix (wHTH) protein
MNRLLAFGPYALDTISRVLTLDNKVVPLPSKAAEVLLALVTHSGQVVSKKELMEVVWPNTFVEEGNLSQHIHLLRRALQDTIEGHRYILTVPGRGYSFVASVRELPDAAPEIKAANEPTARGQKRRPRPSLRSIALGMTPLLVIGAIYLTLRVPLCRELSDKGVQLQGKGELQSAINAYRWALALKPSYADARYNLADAYEEIPDYDKAIEEYQKAIDFDVTLYAAYNNLARLYLKRRKDPGAALSLLDRGMNNNPQENSVKYSFEKNYGWANYELRNLVVAEQQLRQAITLDPNRGAAHCLLAKVLNAEGRDAEARPEWEACLGYSSQTEVEPEWRNEALEQLSKKRATK